jgi:hypothetical protein
MVEFPIFLTRHLYAGRLSCVAGVTALGELHTAIGSNTI